MGCTSKLVFIALGILITLGGFALRNAELQEYIVGTLLVFTGLILIAQVTWDKFLNRSLDDSDLKSGVALITALIMIFAGGFTIFGVQLWQWVGTAVPYITAIVGIFIVVLGFFQR